jgi:predicted MFS family arabinose efflux permease
MPIEWGLLALAIGMGRIAGTIINGRWSRSPRLRWCVGVTAFAYQGLHCFFFWQIGLSVIAIGYLLWTVLEAMAIIRSTIDILRKRNRGCRTG